MTLFHEEFVRRFELHILPNKYVKIRHAGYMCHRGKNDRIADLYKQLKLTSPMPKVSMSTGLTILIKTGIGITLCQKYD
jgi:hypothetical protein